jgi:putative NIF3 family GTP cyclohydrolase 1 type 2
VAGADLLVTHHPLFLGGTTSVAATTAKGRVVHKLITADARSLSRTPTPTSRTLVSATLSQLRWACGTCGRCRLSRGQPTSSRWLRFPLAGADVLLTADLKHHATFEAIEDDVVAFVDAAHWATEWPWLAQAADLRATAATVETTVSTIVTDPWTVHAAGSG